jgi:hypothetical protein
MYTFNYCDSKKNILWTDSLKDCGLILRNFMCSLWSFQEKKNIITCYHDYMITLSWLHDNIIMITW